MVLSWLRVGIVVLAVSGLCCTATAQGVVSSVNSGSSAVNEPCPPDEKPTPYSVTSVTTTVQTLADGTQIRTRTEAHRMRDSEGRTRDETISDGTQYQREASVMIYDPVANVQIMLYLKKKIAHISHMNVAPPQPENSHLMEVQQEYVKALGPSQEEMEQIRAKFQFNTTQEKLGEETIAGLRATGTRSTTVLPIGAVGNDHELRAVNETWMSTEFFMPLRMVQDDPRMGHTETVVTSFDRTPPDPALFRAPDDYRVFDMKP